MSAQISFLPMLDEAEHPGYLLNGMVAETNACGVYTENVLEFREGLIPHSSVCVKLCAVGDYILYEFSYMSHSYGCGHPLCRPCHECHRSVSPEFLAEDIYSVFVNSVLEYDRNISESKDRKALARLCRKVCERIAKEVK